MSQELEILLDLEPEELALHIVGYLKEHAERRVTPDKFNFGTVFSEYSRGLPTNTHQERTNIHNLYQALREAWSWLEANGLIVWSDDANGPNGSRVLSRRANRLNPEELVLFKNASGLKKEHLHESIAHKVWSDFIRGNFDTAVFLSAKQVEVSVKNKSGIKDKLGVPLMREAFRKGGVLSDTSLDGGEQTARMDLFAGFIGSYKNPGSHRDVNMEDPLEAMQVVLFASHLLKIVDAAQ